MNPSPDLTQLPAPPPGKRGWPWTDAPSALSATMPDGRPWPRISIVTPSFNQQVYLEETIRSVLMQGYPNLDYLVIDGGSSDGSLEIIRKYEPWLSYWISELDRGQSHALNKGFARATGQLWAWLNSDDLYLPGALAAFAAEHTRHPEAVLLVGGCEMAYPDGRTTLLTGQAEGYLDFLDPVRAATVARVQQPAFMWLSARAREIGPLDESDHLTMDGDLVLRLLEIDRRAFCFPTPVARFRVHEGQKSGDFLEAAPAAVSLLERHLQRVRDRLPPQVSARLRRNLRRENRNVRGWMNITLFVRSRGKDLPALARACYYAPRTVLRLGLNKIAARARGRRTD